MSCPGLGTLGHARENTGSYPWEVTEAAPLTLSLTRGADAIRVREAAFYGSGAMIGKLQLDRAL
jgi:hypothetical protein